MDTDFIGRGNETDFRKIGRMAPPDPPDSRGVGAGLETGPESPDLEVELRQ